ncbi:MAG: N-acetylmuramoyl-L-alanine amidase [Rhodospirillales bacterium]
MTGVRAGDHPGKTRVVLDLTAKPAFTVAPAADPMRVLIALPGATWRAAGKVPAPSGMVNGVSFETIDGVPQVVIALRKPARIAAQFALPGVTAGSHRLIVDLQETTLEAFNRDLPASAAQTQAAAAPAPTPAPGPKEAVPSVSAPAEAKAAPTEATRAAPAEANPAPVETAAALTASAPAAAAPADDAAEDDASITPIRVAGAPRAKPRPLHEVATGTAGLITVAHRDEPKTALFRLPAERSRTDDRKPVVVIDAGHGGIDSGATSPGGRLEKDLTLAHARELRDQLLATGRYQVAMTRDGDKFLRLRERIAFARNVDADLFVSLHADSLNDSRLRGGSVYTLSDTASDEEAAALAAKENKADLIVGIDLSAQRREVVEILIDLAQRQTMHESSMFARKLIDELGDSQVLLKKAHRYAGFAVLKAPDVPSVLLEMGYLSNVEDERLLSSPEGRASLAAAAVRAIDRYFDRRPPIASRP